MAKRESMRLNINVPQELIDRVDNYAESLSINRTSAVCVLLSMALDSQKMMNSIDELVKMAKSEKKK